MAKVIFFEIGTTLSFFRIATETMCYSFTTLSENTLPSSNVTRIV